MVTNVDFKEWTDYLGDPPLVMAILDRLVDDRMWVSDYSFFGCANFRFRGGGSVHPLNVNPSRTPTGGKGEEDGRQDRKRESHNDRRCGFDLFNRLDVDWCLAGHGSWTPVGVRLG